MASCAWQSNHHLDITHHVLAYSVENCGGDVAISKRGFGGAKAIRDRGTLIAAEMQGGDGKCPVRLEGMVIGIAARWEGQGGEGRGGGVG
jgi:hypothetical protein